MDTNNPLTPGQLRDIQEHQQALRERFHNKMPAGDPTAIDPSAEPTARGDGLKRWLRNARKER